MTRKKRYLKQEKSFSSFLRNGKDSPELTQCCWFRTPVFSLLGRPCSVACLLWSQTPAVTPAITSLFQQPRRRKWKDNTHLSFNVFQSHETQFHLHAIGKTCHKKPHGCHIISINAEKNCSIILNINSERQNIHTHTYT